MFAEGTEEPVRTHAEARALRWCVRISVLGAVIAWLPFYIFVLGVSFTNLYFSYPIGAAAALIAAELGLTVFVKRWKRTVYPSFLIKELHETRGVAAAAKRSSAILQELLKVRGAFLLFRPPGDEPGKTNHLAATGIDSDTASYLAESKSGSETSSDGPSDSQIIMREGRLVLVPLRSMETDVGVLGLMSGALPGDTGDEELLAGLAYAIGTKLSTNYGDEALRASEQRYRTLIETTPDAIVLTSIDGRIILCNSSAARIHGFASSDELVGQFAIDLVGIEDRDRFERDVTVLLKEGAIRTSEYRLTRRDGESFPGEMRASLVRDDQGTPAGILRVHRDVSERKDAEQTIRSLAYYDSLTGLNTRARFLECLVGALETASQQGSTLALMFIDLDGFKNINDDFGHAAGDTVLKTVSRRLAGIMHNGDTAGRLGGDELVALLPNINGPEEAGRTAKQILETIRSPIPADGRIHNVTASIGLALYPQAATGVTELMRAADKAMYAAKRAGGNRVELDVGVPAR